MPVQELELGALGQRAATESEPTWLPDDVDIARVESRRVGADGSHPDGDRIGGGPELVHALPRLLAGDPATARHRDAPVERCGELDVTNGRPLVAHVIQASFWARAAGTREPRP